MIIREWRGRATRARAGEYPAHFRAVVAPELRSVAGFVGATLSKYEVDALVEFVVLTRWKSLEAIQAFAGVDLHRAVVEPGAVAALVDYDKTVRHYEVLEEI
ncbi:MAG: antibiotic biosynthesis monooxygenase [Steroidobacteraceae bacterium]